MERKDKDALIMSGVLRRLNEYRLPRVLALKKKVEDGETLSEVDLNFLNRVLRDARDLNPVLERNPRYLGLRDKAIGLCNQILEQDAENQNS